MYSTIQREEKKVRDRLCGPSSRQQSGVQGRSAGRVDPPELPRHHRAPHFSVVTVRVIELRHWQRPKHRRWRLNYYETPPWYLTRPSFPSSVLTLGYLYITERFPCPAWCGVHAVSSLSNLSITVIAACIRDSYREPTEPRELIPHSLRHGDPRPHQGRSAQGFHLGLCYCIVRFQSLLLSSLVA